MILDPFGHAHYDGRAFAVMPCVISPQNIGVKRRPSRRAVRHWCPSARREGMAGGADPDHWFSRFDKPPNPVELRWRERPPPNADEENISLLQRVGTGKIVLVGLAAEDE